MKLGGTFVSALTTTTTMSAPATRSEVAQQSGAWPCAAIGMHHGQREKVIGHRHNTAATSPANFFHRPNPTPESKVK